MKLEVAIPRAPSLNGNQRNASAGKRYNSPRYKSWLQRAGYSLNPQIAGWKTLTGDVEVTIYVNKNTADIDNLVKPAFDLLEKHGVYKNDSQVTALKIFHDKQCGGLMFVEVEAV